MKSKSKILPALISIVPVGLIILNILDIYDVLEGTSDYPFGSEFFSKYSIYASKKTYLLYNLIFILL